MRHGFFRTATVRERPPCDLAAFRFGLPLTHSWESDKGPSLTLGVLKEPPELPRTRLAGTGFAATGTQFRTHCFFYGFLFRLANRVEAALAAQSGSPRPA